MALENLGKKLAQLGQDTKASVQKMSESYSLNSKIGEEKRALEQLFAQIGEAVFEKAGEEGIPGLEGLEEKFGAVKAAKEAIAGLEEQMGLPEIYANPAESARVAREHREAQEQLDALYETWEELSEAVADQ